MFYIFIICKLDVFGSAFALGIAVKSPQRPFGSEDL